jgi:outer membrane lipoprotein-sorting protein
LLAWITFGSSGDRECVLVRATWNRDTINIVRTMCIDSVAALILRDVREAVDNSRGIRGITTTTFIDYESDPTLPPDTFQFSIPPGAVEAKAPE